MNYKNDAEKKKKPTKSLQVAVNLNLADSPTNS